LVKPNGDGWQRAFLMTSALSALWLILWLRYYERPPAAAKADLQAERYRWSDVIRHRETWAIALLKTTDAVWWFYIVWGGLFLADRFKLNLNQLGLPLIAIYLFADVGSLGGGWLSGHWLKRGWSTNRARKTVLLICALAVTPIAWATQTDSAWVAVALMALGAAAHQAWSVTLFTIPSDLFPKSALASVAGLGGMVGSGTSVAAFLTLGRILSSNTVGGYFWPFAVASLWYLLVLGCFQWLVPTLSPVQKLAASANQNSTKPN
jgi:ACS family hexuronate transporter-like MFS transporter